MPQAREMQVLKGMGVSDGVAIGRAVVHRDPRPEVYRSTSPRSRWRARSTACARAPSTPRASSSGSARRAEEDLGNDLAAIFDAHVLLLSDR